MKKRPFIIANIVALISNAILYMMGAFINNDLLPSRWDMISRVLLCFLWCVCWFAANFITFAMVMEAREKEKS